MSSAPAKLNQLKFPTATDLGKEPLAWSSAEIQSRIPTDILLLTVDDAEFGSCYAYMANIVSSYHNDLSTVYFGVFREQPDREGVNVALIKSFMGPNEALLAVNKAADILNPKVALFVGFCAGNPAKTELGDVLISANLIMYADKKVGQDSQGNKSVEWRGVKPNVSRNMARRILTAHHGWVPTVKDESQGSRVKVHHNAVILSGPELVDYSLRAEKLFEEFKDATGIDTEGAGLYSAAHNLNLEWAVVKGVSYYAGKEEETKDWQPIASAMAASLVHHMFKYPDVIRQWRRYKEVDPSGQTGVATRPVMTVNEGEQATRQNLIDTFVKALNPGNSGQFRYYDGRLIKYEVAKRYPSLMAESCEVKYIVTVTDKTTEISETRESSSDPSEAVKSAVRALLGKLDAINAIDYSRKK